MPQADYAVDPSGWTIFEPTLTGPKPTQKIYVSKDGNNSYDGLYETFQGGSKGPKLTVGAGRSMLRDGYPDWLHLREGDAWDEDLGAFQISGAGPPEPILITSYRPTGAIPKARPKLRVGANNGLFAFNSARYLALVDVELEWIGSPTEVVHGINWAAGGGEFLLEGCKISKFHNALTATDGLNLALRRNVFVDTQRAGTYFSDVAGILMEENVLVRCGTTWPDKNLYQGFYVDYNNHGTIIQRGNVVIDTTQGTAMRSGGTVDNNLFVRCATSIGLGGGGAGATFKPEGCIVTCQSNVVLDGINNKSGSPQGWALRAENIVGGTVTKNIFGRSTLCTFPEAIVLDGANANSGQRVHNLAVLDNIVHRWRGVGVGVRGAGGSQIIGIQIRGNKLHNQDDNGVLVQISSASQYPHVTSSENRFSSTVLNPNAWFNLDGNAASLLQYATAVGNGTDLAFVPNYPDADNATMAAYDSSVGGNGTLDHFIFEALKQRKGAWNTHYTAYAVNKYIRERFGVYTDAPLVGIGSRISLDSPVYFLPLLNTSRVSAGTVSLDSRIPVPGALASNVHVEFE
jgi:hypothetical protein